LRPAELSSGFFLGLALQTAKDDRKPVLVRQAAQLVIKDRLQVAPSIFLGRFGLRHFDHLSLARTPFGGRSLRLERRAHSHTIQPIADHVAWQYGRGFASEYQERGLECVLAILVMSKDSAANSQDHLAVSPHQSFEGGFIAPAEVALQQFPIGKVGPIAHKDRPKLLHDPVHWLVPRPFASCSAGLYSVLPGGGRFPTVFFRADHPMYANIEKQRPV
jgi:hypothetical protein